MLPTKCLHCSVANISSPIAFASDQSLTLLARCPSSPTPQLRAFRTSPSLSLLPLSLSSLPCLILLSANQTVGNFPIFALRDGENLYSFILPKLNIHWYRNAEFWPKPKFGRNAKIRCFCNISAFRTNFRPNIQLKRRNSAFRPNISRMFILYRFPGCSDCLYYTNFPNVQHVCGLLFSADNSSIIPI